MLSCEIRELPTGVWREKYPTRHMLQLARVPSSRLFIFQPFCRFIAGFSTGRVTSELALLIPLQLFRCRPYANMVPILFLCRCQRLCVVNHQCDIRPVVIMMLCLPLVPRQLDIDPSTSDSPLCCTRWGEVCDVVAIVEMHASSRRTWITLNLRLPVVALRPRLYLKMPIGSLAGS